MLECVTQLSLYFNTPITDALNLPVSLYEKILKTKAFEVWKENKLHDAKAVSGISERLNTVIKAINGVVKVISRR